MLDEIADTINELCSSDKLQFKGHWMPITQTSYCRFDLYGDFTEHREQLEETFGGRCIINERQGFDEESKMLTVNLLEVSDAVLFKLAFCGT